MKKTLFLFIITSLIIVSCTTTSDKNYYIPGLNDTTLHKIQDLINAGNPFQAIQDLSYLYRENRGIPNDQLDNLYKRSSEEISRRFLEAIDKKDFLRAHSIFQSAGTLGILKNLLPWNEHEIYKALADKYYNEGKMIPALLVFLKVIETGTPSHAEFKKYGDLALQEENQFALKKITAAMEKTGLPVLEDYKQLVNRNPPPSDMMKGTVTIWVNKGIKVEQGVGYPDRVIGSGFFIDKRGYLITNHHIIDSEVNPKYEGYSRLYIRLSNSKADRLPAKVVGYDQIFDIALIKIEVDAPYIFSLNDKEDFLPGEKIYAIGSPAGLENTITSGIISATRRRFLQMGDAMQVDVPVNPGNSGGPLLNDNGELVGVVFAGLEQFEGINFAIPAHWVSTILPDLYLTDEVKHSWLGLAVHEENNGLEIMYVVPGEPAQRGGLKEGDIILSINGKKLTTIRDMQQYLLSYRPDSLVELQWTRNGEEYSSFFNLTVRPYRPMDVAIKRDVRNKLFLPLFGLKLEVAGRSFLSQNYTVTKVYRGSIADESGISINDPLSIQDWKVDEENRYAILQLNIKKRKAGYLQNIIQIAAYLEVDFFI
ncbi:MAG: trypsin-like peptidase domain-containing protein [Spirochaetota bacterium]